MSIEGGHHPTETTFIRQSTILNASKHLNQHLTALKYVFSLLSTINHAGFIPMCFLGDLSIDELILCLYKYHGL